MGRCECADLSLTTLIASLLGLYSFMNMGTTLLETILVETDQPTTNESRRKEDHPRKGIKQNQSRTVIKTNKQLGFISVGLFVYPVTCLSRAAKS